MLQVNVFPFTTDAIDFDVDSAEVLGKGGVEALIDFVRELGQATLKPVHLSHEGNDSLVFLTYDPDVDGFEG